ncbi:MAG: hypothetical protein ACFFDF_09760, partial [Candidatus Odinarchaeota archaeon]
MTSYSRYRKVKASFFFFIIIFFISNILTLIPLIGYNYQNDWTLVKTTTKIEDNVMYVRNDDSSNTMVNPLSITFPNHTSKIEIDVYPNSHSFKYEILRSAFINKEEHLIVCYLWREGDIDDLPITYKIPDDNHIYKIDFRSLEPNNLTFIAVHVNYEYNMKGLNSISLKNIIDVLLYFLISLGSLIIILGSVCVSLKLGNLLKGSSNKYI